MIFSKKPKQTVEQTGVGSSQQKPIEPSANSGGHGEIELEAAMSLPERASQTGSEGSLLGKASSTIKAPFVKVSQRMRKKLRDTAIDRARTRILIAGQTPETLAAETLEIVVREEEDKLKNQIKEKGLLFVVASLGLGWWF